MKPVAILPTEENIIIMLNPADPKYTDVWIYLRYGVISRRRRGFRYVHHTHHMLTDGTGSMAYALAGTQWHCDLDDLYGMSAVVLDPNSLVSGSVNFPSRSVIRRMIREGVKEVM